MTAHNQFLPGTLNRLILRAVSLGPMHGCGIVRSIDQNPGNPLLIEQHALHRQSEEV